VRRPPGTIRIGSIAGSDVLVSSSWFLVAGLVAVLVAPRVDEVQPGLGGWKYVAGLAFAVVLYLSVLLHEASHAVMARRYGFPVSSITLHFLGGMTAIEGEANRPRQEFMIAVVGPLTSIAVGAGAVGLWFVTPDGLLRMAPTCWSGSSTSFPDFPSTADASSSPWSGGRPAACTAAPSSRAGAVGSRPWPYCPGRSSRRAS
jgi:Zn-dependent protease